MNGGTAKMSKRKFVNIVVHCTVLACSIFILALYVSIPSSPVEAESPAFLRVVHASPDVGTVDVFAAFNMQVFHIICRYLLDLIALS